MGSLEATRIHRTLIWAGSGVLVLWALSTPALGPVMDHHFAERQHNHFHIYFGPPEVDHIHPYQDRHGHRPIRSANQNDMNIGLSAPNISAGVVYLAPLDGMGQDSLASRAPMTQPVNPFSNQGDPSLLLTWPQHYDHLQETYVPLPKRPPRT